MIHWGERAIFRPFCMGDNLKIADGSSNIYVKSRGGIEEAKPLMNPSSSKGNRPELWAKFLDHLDEKLQLGLLDQMKRVQSYHFEADILYIQPSSESDYEYLKGSSHFQQLEILAQAALQVDRVKLTHPDDEAK
ncbi:hypothetical protein EBR25_09790 [bacterium]|jgi:hypothetical protein|nr:hypothetical protein [bacterium]